MADALARKFDVVVAHKPDRFSRNLRITLEYFDKLLKAGVAFVSISEQMDFTTPSGKVHLTLLGAARFEVEGKVPLKLKESHLNLYPDPEESAKVLAHLVRYSEYLRAS